MATPFGNVNMKFSKKDKKELEILLKKQLKDVSSVEYKRCFELLIKQIDWLKSKFDRLEN